MISSSRALLLLLVSIFILTVTGCSTGRFVPLKVETRQAFRRSQGRGPSVRVLVDDSYRRITVTGGDYVVRDSSGSVVSEGMGETVIEEMGGRLVSGRRGSDYFRIESKGAVVIDGDAYPGKILLVPYRGRIGIVNTLPLEDYVKYVMREEVPPSFHPEALKAISVAVRTYALFNMEKNPDSPFHVTSHTLHQVYRGSRTVDRRLVKAVDGTRGMVVLYRGRYALTVYHSTCGGRTESSENAWGKSLPYLKTVECGYCRHSPRYRWEFVMEGDEFLYALEGSRAANDRVRDIEVVSRNSSGRVDTVKVETEYFTKRISGNELRKKVGFEKVRSLAFDVKYRGGMVYFSGKGYGHGVGLCQYGADGMGRDGYGFDEIIAHYYGTRVRIVREY